MVGDAVQGRNENGVWLRAGVFIIGYIGGLASQMNNYAFMLAMKRQFPGLSLKAADGCFEHNGYELERVFGIKLDWADRTTVQRLVNFHIGESGLFCKACNAGHELRKMLFGPRKTQLSMRDFATHDMRAKLGELIGDFAVWGNCTRETYLEVGDDMRRQFKFVRPLDGTNKMMAERMATCNSVSVHLRRGDYAACGFKLLGADYYRAAVSRIKQSVKDPNFFVFSDDLPCAKEMFRDLPRLTFVEGNRGKDSYIDMQLMSSCKHNVVANSGFSILGAFLGNPQDRVVVAPRCLDANVAAATEKFGWIQL